VGTAHGWASLSPVRQAWLLLYAGFIAAPLLAGLDKFFNLLTNWTQYIAPVASRVLGGHDQQFMYLVGVVEIVAGIGVALRPRLFAYVVAVWLLAIIVNLLLTGMYFDIALRDLGLLLGALALARLSVVRKQV
jgi:hypothetical protein